MSDLIQKKGVTIHPTADVSDDSQIGEGSFIWNNAQVREKSIIGKNCIVSKDVYVDTGVIIGNNVKIQNGVSVYNGVIIEDDVLVGPCVAFTNDLYPRAFNSDWKITPTKIKKGASLGANSTLICGIVVNEYAMIGAGSVVTRDVPSHALVIGNPAKIIAFVCKCGKKLIEERISDSFVTMSCSSCENECLIPLYDYEKKK